MRYRMKWNRFCSKGFYFFYVFVFCLGRLYFNNYYFKNIKFILIYYIL